MLLYRHIFYYALCSLRYHCFYLGQFIKDKDMAIPMLSPGLQLAEQDENIMLTRTYFAVHETISLGGEDVNHFPSLFLPSDISLEAHFSSETSSASPKLKRETRCKSHWFTLGNTLERSKSAHVQAVSCGRSVAAQSIQECIVKSMLCIIRALQG